MQQGEKTQRRTFFTWCLKACAAGCTAFLLLNVFCFFYSNQGAHQSNPTGATDYTWRPNAFFSVMTEGVSAGHFDENGFNNAPPLDAKDVDILLMGSSHMEAMEVMPEKNTAYLLQSILANRGLGGGNVYNIGTSGHGLADCIDNLEAALTEYHPKKLVVMETMTLDFSVEQMKRVLSGTREKVASHAEGMIGLLQKFPYLKQLYAQLKTVRGQAGGDIAVAEKVRKAQHTEVEYPAELNALLKKAADAAQRQGCKLIIFYQPTLILSREGAASTGTDGGQRAAFSAACKKQNILFLDMTDLFLETYQKEHKLPHGFANTAVGVGHLNKTGHELIAQALADLIAEGEVPSK